METLNPRVVLLVYFTVLVHGRVDYKKIIAFNACNYKKSSVYLYYSKSTMLGKEINYVKILLMWSWQHRRSLAYHQ